ncbi:dynamin family protein [Jidongwangia harbinensis]|uniref:dynamin family protein n=1 Tax=Jidongwangia harbinensis TaxID=2878561 RepID=UPI001CD92530|nr:dynamin family protein [Jidongwangia harbinensis]MCA2216650.1 dynamin family protein [Jidongwangia harbinensis]
MTDDNPTGPDRAAAPRLDARQAQAVFGAVRLLTAHDARPAADLVLARLRSPGRRRPAVVVVGEVKRGKSSLVNALAGEPGRSPVGVDVTTAAFIRIVPASARRPAGSARVFAADGTPMAVAAGDVAGWVTVGGASRADPDAPIVVGAEVAVAASLLPELSLIDTPGVGGLDGGHATLAAGVAAKASVLLFVSDAGQPLTAPELAFLARAAATTETVVFAMTKIDMYPAGWREVLAENRELLRRHAPRFAGAEVVPVSSTLAAEAARLPDGELRRAMTTASGVHRLADVLNAHAADRDRLVVANAARIARTGLDQVAVQLRVRRSAAAGDAADRAELAAERERLAELRDRQQRWTLDLERDLGGLRRGVVDDVTGRLTDLRHRWERRFDSERRLLVPAVAKETMAQICSELQAVVAEVAGGFDRRLRTLVADSYGLTAEAVPADVGRELVDTRPRPREHTRTLTGLLDPSLAATAFFGAGMAAQLPIAAVAGLALLNPVVVGGAWLAVNVAYRAVRAGRTQMRTWLAETVNAMQADLVAAADTALREAKPDLVLGIRRFLADAIAGVDAALREADRAAVADDSERRRRIEALDRHLAAVAAAQEALDGILRVPGTSDLAAASKPATP